MKERKRRKSYFFLLLIIIFQLLQKSSLEFFPNRVFIPGHRYFLSHSSTHSNAIIGSRSRNIEREEEEKKKKKEEKWMKRGKSSSLSIECVTWIPSQRLINQWGKGFHSLPLSLLSLSRLSFALLSRLSFSSSSTWSLLMMAIFLSPLHPSSFLVT